MITKSQKKLGRIPKKYDPIITLRNHRRWKTRG